MSVGAERRVPGDFLRPIWVYTRCRNGATREERPSKSTRSCRSLSAARRDVVGFGLDLDQLG